jgi:hypothetical protein
MRHGKRHGQDSRPENGVKEIDNATDPAGLPNCSSDISLMMGLWTSAESVSKCKHRAAVSLTVGLYGGDSC